MTRLPNRPFALLAAFLLLLLAAACATTGTRTGEAAAPLPEGPTGTLEGTVTDAYGSGVGGAHITVHHPSYARKWTGRTDMEGNFLLLDLPAGDGFKVTVSTPPFWTTTLRGISISAGKTTTLTVVRRLGHKGGPMSPPGSED